MNRVGDSKGSSSASVEESIEDSRLINDVAAVSPPPKSLDDADMVATEHHQRTRLTLHPTVD